MLIEDLFNQVLVLPAQNCGANRIRIVSGFATTNMVDLHMNRLHELNLNRIRIELIVGMTKNHGIELIHHHGFKKLAKECSNHGIEFNCKYVVMGNPVHAKTYCWLKEKTPIKSFIGSANYTMTGFGNKQVEAMIKSDPIYANNFFLDVNRRSHNCLDTQIEDHITFQQSHKLVDSVINNKQPYFQSITLSLLTNGVTPKKSGINWGQRKQRNPNQAYIPIPSQINKLNFFPAHGKRFTVLTDDDKIFIMARAQANGKALHTTNDNSQIGSYLRSRIQVDSGIFVTKKHLTQYGRTDVKFSKIDDETYYMDFSAQK